ncbi:MAG: transcriptional repressor [Anaerolineae bacterium]|nr:transcriptional repressor [Anaerolineae bacterium]
MHGWERCLAAAGCRVTRPRRVVMHVLEQARRPLSAQEVLERGRRLHPALGLVTVYRTLALFAELGLVRRAHGEEGCHGYLLTSPGHCHAVVCRACGRAVEFPGGHDLDGLIAQVEAETGYRVDGHLLQLFGLCAACQGDRA